MDAITKKVALTKREILALNAFKAFNSELFDNMVHLLGERKANLWFYTENPNIADIRPVDLIMIGREEKLISFIKNAISENKEE